VKPDIAAIPGSDGPVETPTPPATDVDPKPEPKVDFRAADPKTPVKPRGQGEVTLVLLPEATVFKGKQELGRGMMMSFTLPVGTHLVTVVGPDGVKRKLSLPVQPGKNRPMKLRVDELPEQ
jgi:hypothetical protein